MTVKLSCAFRISDARDTIMAILWMSATHAHETISLNRCGKFIINNNFRNVLEYFINAFSGFCWGFEECESMLLSKSTTFFSVDNFILTVTLVGDKNFSDISIGMLIYLLEPVWYVIESRLIGAVVDKNDPHGTFVISLSDRAKPFLSSCVPDL